MPNRALREAINFEGDASARETRHIPKVGEAKADAPSSNHRRRGTWSCWAPAAIPASYASGGRAIGSSVRRAAQNPPHHYQVLNKFLSSLNDKYRLDCSGTALLPMSIEDEVTKMLLVIESPPGKETFRLYTHFNGSIDRCRECKISTENRVLGNLLRCGRHKSLTLSRVCDERMRFTFEERNTEISSEAWVMNVLDMFVKVSCRMKRIVEATPPPRSDVIPSTLMLPPQHPASTSDSSTAAVVDRFEGHSSGSSMNRARFALGCGPVSEESWCLRPATDVRN